MILPITKLLFRIGFVHPMSSSLSTNEEIAALLERLGSTPDEVAQTFRLQSIKGVPYAVRLLNPVVQIVLRQLNIGALMVDVIKGDHLTITLSDWRQESTPLPSAVAEFQRRFNRKEYLDLILPS